MTDDAKTDVETVERVIPAPPEAIFDLLADPEPSPRHRRLGHGARREGEPERLTLGSKFGMSMKMGIPYSMVSTVIEFEENRRIAWQTRRIRGPLSAVASGATSSSRSRAARSCVRAGTSRRRCRSRSRLVGRDGAHQGLTESMTKTLERIEELVKA